jgi:endonuclease YncB( thermonuclease family)
LRSLRWRPHHAHRAVRNRDTDTTPACVTSLTIRLRADARLASELGGDAVGAEEERLGGWIFREVNAARSPPLTRAEPRRSHSSPDHVADGDTITLRNEQRVRLVKIDTPEVCFGLECYGRQASARTSNCFLRALSVFVPRTCDHRVDDFGRLLRHVIRAADGMNVNLRLVAIGAVFLPEPSRQIREAPRNTVLVARSSVTPMASASAARLANRNTARLGSLRQSIHPAIQIEAA